jgi:uncharacterized protein YutE (UPF0331/DUF86 family)
MEKERIAILKAELEAQAGEIEKIYARLDERSKKKGKAAAESIGYQLHNLYCAFEDLFEIVARTFENNIHDKGRYHLELLKRMTIAIQDVRPSLLSEEVFVLLDNLRSFRHFFRHAYSYDLDERKVRIVLADSMKLRHIYQKDLSAFVGSF